jgi:hypothetical protein
MRWPWTPKRDPNARTHVVDVTGRRNLDPDLAANSKLRRRPTPSSPKGAAPKRGMFVVYMGKVGILTELLEEDVARVQVIEPLKGHNQSELYMDNEGNQKVRNHVLLCPAADMRQAWLDEVPTARWVKHPKTGEPWVAGMQSLGYERAP